MGERPDVTSGRSLVRYEGNMNNMSRFVYILESQKNKTYYIGSTNNLERRLDEHNSGKVKYTKNLKPWKLKFFKKYDSLTEARKVEYKQRRDIIEKIIKGQKIIMGVYLSWESVPT